MATEAIPQPNTAGDLIAAAADRIASSDAIELWRPYMAKLEAETLLAEALGHAADAAEVVPAKVRVRFDAYIERRVAGEPAALIVGHTTFRGLQLRTRRGVFVPRSSSESMAAMAIQRLRARRAPVAVDVATGSGPVALSVAAEVPKARVVGVDISPAALSLARDNAKRLRITNATFVRSDVLTNLPGDLAGGVDVLTVHPPYVAREQLADLPAEIREFEPEESLTDQSDDGLGLVRRLVEQAPDWLRRGGWVLVEVSPDLSRRVGGLLRRNAYRDVKSHRDSLGATRVVAGRR
ncbi:MAG TPA: HemK/PrmC family methyltransferase [Actinomycetota bacterium]|nr:HemK/PrmC family methyltransferase [Actinomycetota bacterium]